MISMRIFSLLFAAVAALFPTQASMPTASSARSGEAQVGHTLLLEGWIPFWAKASGTKEALLHRELLSTVDPFSLEVNPDGTLFDRFASDGGLWGQFNASSSTHKVKVVPTIAWFDPERIDAILSSSTSRKAHITNIVAMVKSGHYDGVDIDYEGKWLRTRDAYSIFIRELASALAPIGASLRCTVEARTPAEDRSLQLPREMSHASDYKVLNEACAAVRIMAYDQRDDDQRLVYENGDVFYRPVADDVWVEKTIREALYEIDRKKLILGIPTYGNVYSAVKGKTHTIYTHVGAINYGDALRRALYYGAIPFRNAAGELQFGYVKDKVQYYVSFTDAVAVKKKLLLAEKYGLLGVSLFKIDGGMDKRIWTELKSFI